MLILNSSRLLAELAAEATRGEPLKGLRQASWRQVVDGTRLPAGRLSLAGRAGLGLDPGEPQWSELSRLLETAVLGGPDPLQEVLTEDARGWSPTFSFESRDAVTRALRDQPSPILPVVFGLESLLWADPVVVAEWRLDAVVADPILVADDLLVEAQGRPFTIGGSSLAELRAGRIALIHTYFDEAAVIEQVILDR